MAISVQKEMVDCSNGFFKSCPVLSFSSLRITIVSHNGRHLPLSKQTVVLLVLIAKLLDHEVRKGNADAFAF